MKTIRSVLGSIALLFMFVAANAASKPVADKMTKDDVVKTYTDDIANSKVNDLDKILDDNLQFNMKRGDNINTLNKDQFLDFMKNSASSGESATITSTVVTDDEYISVVRVDFKYADYTRTDEITLNNANGWTISKITTWVK